jgi:hypothetical protein
MGLAVLWHVFVIGVAILVVAIVVNGLAIAAGVSTWYGFLEAVQAQGLLQAIRRERPFSLLFLLLLYPFILGLTGYGLARWLM